jgi:hypothetical protein
MHRTKQRTTLLSLGTDQCTSARRWHSGSSPATEGVITSGRWSTVTTTNCYTRTRQSSTERHRTTFHTTPGLRASDRQSPEPTPSRSPSTAQRHTTDIQVQEDSSYLDGKSRHEFVQEFAPVLNFHPDEEFYPTRYEAYIENSDLKYDDSLGIDDTLLNGATLTDIGQNYSISVDDLTGPDSVLTTSASNYIDPRTEGEASHAAYQNAVERVYPETVYSSIHRNIEFNGERYTAIGYWMTYIHDPKPDGEGLISSVAAHTGDQEVIFMLVDSQANPEWIGASQHFGGELRRWGQIRSINQRPVLYPGEGSHPTFLAPDTADSPNESISPPNNTLEYLYQQQYLCNGDGDPTFCTADGSGSPIPVMSTVARPAAKYTDPVAGPQQDAGALWKPSVASGGIVADETYDVTLLSGNESWGAYEGDLYRYPTKNVFTKTRGSIPVQQFRWENDSAADRSLSRYLDSREPSPDSFEIFPDRAQTDGGVCGTPFPDPVCLLDVNYGLSGTPEALTVSLSNTGFKPHEFVVNVTATQSGNTTTMPLQSVFIGTGDIKTPTDPRDKNEIDPASAPVKLPLELNETGGALVNVSMSLYPDDLGDGYLEGKQVVDYARFSIPSEEPGNLTITDVDGSAGSINATRPVGVSVRLERNGTPIEPDNAPETYNITVGNRSVPESGIIVNPVGDGNGEYELTFTPPTQPEPGEYDLRVAANGVSDNRSDAIVYGEGTVTQVATSLQIDRSGSMSGILNEAKEGASTFVQQATAQDYISVVSYATGSRIDQDLVRLNNSRQDVLNAITGLSAFGNTNIGDAMTDGLSTLDTAPNGTVQAGVLLTDGKRNAGPGRSFILNNIVPDYNDEDICLYTIGFTDDADEAFMQDIASAADCGGYRFAGESDEVGSIRSTLQAVFQDIAGEVAGAETITSENGTVDPNKSITSAFDIDGTVTQVTTNLRLAGANLTTGQDAGEAIVRTSDVNAAGTEEISLRRPDGSEVNGSDPRVNTSIVGDALIYRITDPESGAWTYEINNTGQDPSEYTAEVTADAQATLDADTAGGTYYVGGQVTLTATLAGPTGGVSGATVTANVTDPAGTTRTTQLERALPGVYTGSVTVGTNGTYSATITAQNGSLTRTETISWPVNETPPLTVRQETTPDVLQGESGQFNLSVSNTTTMVRPSANETVSLDISELTATSGTATIPATQIELSTRSLSPAGGQNATVTITTPETTPPGTYRGTVRAFQTDGGIVTETVNITVLRPATFDVTVTDTNSPVEEGEPLDLTVRTVNTGNISDTQQLSLSILGLNETVTRNVTLPGGGAVTENLSVPTAVRDAGNYTGIVSSGDDSTTTALRVLGPARFEVGIDERASTTVAPDNGTVRLRTGVVNTGDEAGTQTVRLQVGGDRVATEEVQLKPGNATAVEFVYQATTADDGANASVSTANATARVPLEIPPRVFSVGDTRMDGGLGIVDAVLIQQHLANLDPTPFEQALADVDRDGETTIVDAVLLQQFLAGIVTEGELTVSDVRLGERTADHTADIVNRTIVSESVNGMTDTELILADLENTGGLGKLQDAELRVAETKTGLDDSDAVVTTPVVDIAPGGEIQLAFVLPGVQLSTGDWVGVYTDDDEERFQI